jgi:hypothetical protein
MMDDVSFCLLMSAIWFAPRVGERTSSIFGSVYLVGAVLFVLRGGA